MSHVGPSPDPIVVPTSPWSDQARVMVRPFATYGALDPPRRWLLALGRVALLLLVLGSFVSLTSAGRLVALHVAGGALAWSFAPLLQAGAFAIAVRIFAPTRSLREALGLYFLGHAPWLSYLVVVGAICPLLPALIQTPAFVPAAFATMVAVQVWSCVLTIACLRSGLGFGRARTALAALLFYALYVGSVVGWYLLLDNIQPQLGR